MSGPGPHEEFQYLPDDDEPPEEMQQLKEKISVDDAPVPVDDAPMAQLLRPESLLTPGVTHHSTRR